MIKNSRGIWRSRPRTVISNQRMENVVTLGSCISNISQPSRPHGASGSIWSSQLWDLAFLLPNTPTALKQEQKNPICAYLSAYPPKTQNSAERPRENLNTDFPKQSLLQKGNSVSFYTWCLGPHGTFVSYSGGTQMGFPVWTEILTHSRPHGQPGEGQSNQGSTLWIPTWPVPTPSLPAL